MRRAALACLLATALTGCGGGSGEEPGGDPAGFIVQLVRNVAAGRHDAAWADLYPPHQRVAARAEYARCEERDPFPGRLAEVVVLKVFDEPARVAGQPQPLQSIAVRVRMVVRRPTMNERFEHTFHAVAVDGRWRWYLPAARFDAYRAGLCPTG
jgi:hypothetical protein